MKVYKTDEIRNVALLGNAGSGKTTLAEAMLLEGGVIKRRGSVETKNTVSDYFPVEQEYGYSVFPTVLYTEYDGKKINFIDCPGSFDFVAGAISAMSVTDASLMVVNAQNGVEVGTENLFRYTEKAHKPVLFIVNQLDHDKADFEKTLESLRTSFGPKVVVVQYPITVGSSFNAAIDVLKMKMYQWGPDGGEPQTFEIPAQYMEQANEYHNVLVESAAENDEELLNLYLEEGNLSEAQMRDGIRKGLAKRDLFPVFCLSAKKDMGIRRLMQFINNVVPSPLEVKPTLSSDGKVLECNPDGATILNVFKTSVEHHLGEVSYFKVVSGTVKEGMDLTNTTRDAKERLTAIYTVAGQNRAKVSELVAGDIGATVKLKETKTYHTLVSKGGDIKIDPIKLPESKFRTAIKAVTESDDEKLGEVLHRMHEEDPSWIIEYSKELKQVIVHGQGEFHLRTMKWRIEHNDKIEVKFIEPRIPYRETITKIAAADYRHKKQSGGAGQFGEVHLVIEPYYEGMPAPTTVKIGGQDMKISVRSVDETVLDWGGKLVFVNCIVGGAIDTRFLPAILKGILEKMEEGPLTGSYARDIRVCVYDGKMHPVDSNEISFKLAGRNAFSKAFREAGPKILEPIYDIEVLTPGDRMGDVMSDLQGRRAVIMGMESDKGFEIIKAKVPLKEMASFSTTLSSNTGGRAMFSMKFANYEKVPPEIQEKLLKEYAATQDED